jgi:hypothetical protein
LVEGARAIDKVPSRVTRASKDAGNIQPSTLILSPLRL